MEDLWPELKEESTVKAPVAVLREQAALLAEKTGHVVEARVERLERAGLEDLKGDAAKPGHFRYSFLLVAPRLENYRYRLFQVYHDYHLYPVILYPDDDVKTEVRPGGEEGLMAENEADFRKLLRSIFSAEKTAKVLQALLAQSPKEG